MTTRRTTRPWLAAALLLAACTSQPAAETARIEEKTVALEPATIPVQVGILTGRLENLSVVQRVNAKTGEVVYAPQLRGTLTLRNSSPDPTVRLLGGHVEYLDAAGATIGLAPDRGDTSFRFYGDTTQDTARMDAGAEISHRVDVPFPAAALDRRGLSDIRLSVTYLPAPNREESVTVSVAIAGR